MQRSTSAPPWASCVLYAAAVYNLIWGAAIIAAPLALFRWAGMETPRYPQIWQCVGMIVGVYGVGYWLAARDPFRHWPIVLVGFLGKILGPIGFLNAALTDQLPWAWGATILTNDLIWWVPFGSILYLAFRYNSDTSRGAAQVSLEDAIRTFRGSRNATLFEISKRTPTLLVFLRHSGCTFCRQTLGELAKLRSSFGRDKVELAVVHMGQPMDGTLMMQKYRLQSAHHFSDPDCVLYSAFGLRRGDFHDLFALKIVARGMRAIADGHGLGKLAGDGFRMSGSFILVDGIVIAEHRAETASDIGDFDALLQQATSIVAEPNVATTGTSPQSAFGN